MSAREKRLNTPPTWKSSATRALLAAGIVFLFILISSKKNGLITAVGFSLVALIFYIPAGYYLELTLYRRRQRKQLMNKGGGR
jgi:hypothetical protein